jgi:hypothetical protein
VRKEIERLLHEGYPVAPALLNPMLFTDPDFGYELTCRVAGFDPQVTGSPCSPPQTDDSEEAKVLLFSWQAYWTRRGAEGVRVCAWDPADPHTTRAVDVWPELDAASAAMTMGGRLVGQDHTRMRRQLFWVVAHLLVVVSDTPEHGRALHTVEPRFYRRRSGNSSGRVRSDH